MLDPAKMAEATRLTRAGQLAEATALLQRMLRGESPSNTKAGRLSLMIDATPQSEDTDRPSSAPIGINSRSTGRPFSGSFTSSRLQVLPRLGALFRGEHPSAELVQGLMQPAAVSVRDIAPDGGKFVEATYTNPAGSRAYKLYIPSGYHGEPIPLVVMLHGCKQSPNDFAAGTRMNFIAEEQTCLVVYPAQPIEANAAKCWNWFRPADQRRGYGEPSLIAGITQQVMRGYSVDPERVYIGGLSAGGAAAAVMGVTYPDLYAAVGVHSGLACGSAIDIPSAFAAMRQGVSSASTSGNMAAAPERGLDVPTIVFHGDQDNTVHPRNGDRLIAQEKTAKLQKKIHRSRASGGHAYTRTIHTDPSGRVLFEHWEIHGAGHAWSGGSSAGSYTDPRGPDAAREMLRFFLEHQNRLAAV
jgi:poly(hydroxyalkanoate) depolymerase family esterase